MSVRRDQRRVLAFLGAVCVASWSWSFRLASQTGEGAGVHHHPDAVWPLFLMWAAMMVAMMVPPEVPRVLWLVGANRPEQGAPVRHSLAFLLGYLAPWMLASVGAALLQARLAASGLLTADMATRSRLLGGAVLVSAGLMQLSPLKRACLERCRFRASQPSPPEARLVASGLRGGIQGAASIGSCGLLMLVLFVTGVMSQWAMLLLTLLLVLENIAPPRWPVRFVAGGLLLGWGASLFLL
jgi:predicted metal-binding membrane protein